MNRSLNRAVTLALIVFAGLAFTPRASAQHWYKGNLHTHTLWSDGDGFPEAVVAWYKNKGYHFLSLTEHNVLPEVEKWLTVPGRFLTRESFDAYVQQFGGRVDSSLAANGTLRVRLKTLKEFRSDYEEPGRFLLVNGEEVTSNYSGQPIHVNAINVKELVPRQYGSSKTEVMQHVIHTTLNQGKRLGVKMFPILNHPNFWKAVAATDMMDLQHARFFEVHNAIFGTHNYGDAYHDSTEVIWDKVNMHFLRQGRPLLFGVGNDDAHHYQKEHSSLNNPGRAWVMVNAPKLEPEAIAAAMIQGDFYASTGVTLKELVNNGNRIAIRIDAAPGVVYTIQFIGARLGADKTEILREVKGTEAEYVLGKNDWFVRARILSSRLKPSTAYVGDYETAWTQPVSKYAVPFSF